MYQHEDAEQQHLTPIAAEYEPAEHEIDLTEESINRVRARLEFHFMDPWKKWQKRNTRPWKLLVQILKLILFTSQLLLFGSDMARFITFKDEMQVTFKQLFLKDWDPSNDAVLDPSPFAAYTKRDFSSSIDYSIRVFSNLSEITVGPFGYQTDQTGVVPPITFCMTNYVQAEFKPTQFSFNYSTDTRQECTQIRDFAEPNSADWIDFDITQYLKTSFNFETLISAQTTLPLRTLLVERAATGETDAVCFNVDVVIDYDNERRDGQVIIGLVSLPTRATCNGLLREPDMKYNLRLCLNLAVLLFCLTSSTLCIRSLVNSYRLLGSSQRALRKCARHLEYEDKCEFLDPWLLLIVLTDLLIAAATCIILYHDDRLLETNNYTLCSMLVGIGNFLSWSGLLRYLSFFRKYNLLILTLRKSFFHVIRFMLCTTLIYCGFCFCGWVVFGPYHFKFRRLSTTTECLFSLINGDDMFETFALLRSDIASIWWFSRIYLYLFVALFIYVVLSLFIALIMDTYEIIKQYSDHGFPKSRLQLFYMDGDLSKLPMLNR